MLKTHFEQYSIANQQNFTRIFKTSENRFYHCDPVKHIEDVTYHQLTHFDQAVVVNLDNMLVDGHPISCAKDCEQITHGRQGTCSKSNYCESDKWCNSFYDCQKAQNPLHICRDKESQNRRYEFFDGGCETHVCNASRLTAYNHRRGFFTCDQCICFCDEFYHKAHRILSLQEHVSNVEENEVITGFKIERKRRVFFLQIQVGKLLQMNEIDEKTVRWIPIKYVSHILENDQDGHDYHILRRNARLDMDYIWLPNNQVVTGIKII